MSGGARTSRSRWPAWLAVLALTLHLLAPGLCLAQSLAAAPLGALCSAGDTSAPPTAGGAEAAHGLALDHCELCVAGAALVADTAPHGAAPAAGADAPLRHADAARQANSAYWRPPPRGPPGSA
jgi:hypothetical protein